MNAPHPLAGFDFTPRDVLAAIRRYALRALLVFLAVLAAGAALYAVTPVVHESQAAILVRFGRESVYRAEVGTDAVPLVPTSTDRDEMVNTQIQLFRSRDAITATIEAIGLARLYPQLAEEPPQRGMDIARRRFDRSLRVTRSRASAVVQLAFRHPDPVLAQAALAELLQQQRRLSANVFGGADIAFYDTSVEQAEARLAAAQRRLAAFQAEQGVLAFAEQLPLLLHQRQDLLAARRDADAVLAGLDQRLEELAVQLARIPREVVAWEDTEQSRAAEDARARLLALRVREQDLLTRFSETSAAVQQARREIAEIETFLRQAADRFVGTVRRERNPTLGDIERDIQRSSAERSAARARSALLARQIEEVERDIGRLSAARGARTLLEAELQSAENILRNLLTRREEARLVDRLAQFETVGAGFVQSPTRPDPRQPASPDLVRSVAMSLLVAGGAAVTTIIGSALLGARRRRPGAAAP